MAGCSGSDGGSSVEKSPTSAPAGPEPLRILVSNDDSYAAPGIDVLVEALLTLDAVEVTVVAPLEERSGSGAKVTDGEVAVTDVETAGGYPAKAVDGFPADAVRVAIEELDIDA
ncbi:MAG: survival protein SurE, partial [Acidimicrobiia bacterium]|nr:survival protein SurE [Acidimicrobiia bacterium]